MKGEVGYTGEAQSNASLTHAYALMHDDFPLQSLKQKQKHCQPAKSSFLRWQKKFSLACLACQCWALCEAEPSFAARERRIRICICICICVFMCIRSMQQQCHSETKGEYVLGTKSSRLSSRKSGFLCRYKHLKTQEASALPGRCEPMDSVWLQGCASTTP